MFTSLEGRSVIVTGGSKGIGKGIARVFARQGARVMIAARDETTLAAAADELAREHEACEVATVIADVAKVEDCQRIAEETVAAFGGIDVLCANAGVFPDTKLDDMTEADFDAIFATNVKGNIFTVQACLPALAASGRGRVILTSSITGPITGFPGWSHYGATKAAQLGFLRTAAIELGTEEHHDQRRAPGQHRDGGARRARGGLHSWHGGGDPAAAAGQGRGHRVRRALLRQRRGVLRDRAVHSGGRRTGVAGIPRCHGCDGGLIARGRSCDRSGSHGVLARLQEQMNNGQLRPGARLGAERDLATELGVSRSTVRQALAALEAAGAVRRVPGRGGGTFVSGRKVERDLSRVVGVPALLRSQGMTSGSRVVRTGIVAADEATRAALDLASEAYVVDVVRIRLADGIPISLEHARFPAERFPRLLEMPLGESLYDLLEKHYATLPGEAEEHIEVAAASADEAAILATEIGAPLLSITRVTRDRDGVPFESSHDLFRADRTLITVRTPPPVEGETAPGRLVELRTRMAL